MTDTFADLEEPKKRTLPTALLALALIGGLAIHQLSNPRPIQLSGVIEPTRSKNSLGNPSVRLDNGLVVTAQISRDGPFVPGDHVIVIENVSLTAKPIY